MAVLSVPLSGMASRAVAGSGIVPHGVTMAMPPGFAARGVASRVGRQAAQAATSSISKPSSFSKYAA